MKPTDGEYTRKSDPKNKSLSPGERAINWCKALATAWPVILGLVGLLGYTNQDHIKNWVGLAEADGKTEIEAGDNFQHQVQKFSQEVQTELERIRANSDSIRKQLAEKDQTNYSKLQSRLNKIDERLRLIEGLVQP